MNINKRIKQTIAAIVCTLPVFGMISCHKDILNPKPKTQIAEANAFDTPERVLAQVYGLYDALKSGNFLGGRYLIYNDIRGEEFINRLTNGVTGLQTWNHTLSSSTNEVQNLWVAIYAAVNRINVFLKGLNDNKDKIDPNLFKQYTAEAKFMRALCYYDLLTLYARPYADGNGSKPGMPLRMQAETTTANNDLARSSVQTTYDVILADLNAAEADLPSAYSSSARNVTRAHKNTAIALKTRILLSMGRYSDVVNEASKIVSGSAPYQAPNGVAHKLEANVTTPFTNYTTTESIFSMPMTDTDAPGVQNQLCYYYNVPGLGNGEYFINKTGSGIFTDTSWKATDARKVNFLIVSGTNTYLKKFNKPSPFTDYVPVIRYAEILLNYAEAAAEKGDLTKAVELLKAVRNRSDATYVFATTTVDTKDKIIARILIERRIELLGEGFRSIDILRRLQTIPSKSTVNSITPWQQEYIWPIPSNELLANKLMTPN